MHENCVILLTMQRQIIPYTLYTPEFAHYIDYKGRISLLFKGLRVVGKTQQTEECDDQ